MNRYDFLCGMRLILSNVLTDSNFDIITLVVNFPCDMLPIMIRYDFLEARRMILSNVRTYSILTYFQCCSTFYVNWGK